MAQNIDTGLMLRMEASLAKFEKQMQRATQVGTKTATDVERRFDVMGKRMAVSSEKAARGLGNVVNIGGRGRFVLQNTAAQLGDIAVQLEMGTSASRVMSQQLPQLLGGFGALGGALGLVAPLLGTVAAVGIPLAAMFFAIGGDSEKAGEKVQSFTDRLDAARAALGRAEDAMAAASSGGIEDLRAKYGEVTIAVSELADALADIEKRAARLELGGLMDGLFDQSYEEQIGKMFGAVGQALVGATQDQVDEAKRIIADTQAGIEARQIQGIFVSQKEIDDLALMREELAVLQGDLANAGSLAGEITLPPELLTDIATFEQTMRNAVAAGDFEGARDAIEGMRQALVSAGMTVEDDIFRRVAVVEDVVRETANRFSEAEANAGGVANAAAGIAGPVGAAADEAARLSGNLAGALAQLAGVASGIATANRLASQAAQRRIDYAGDPVGLAGAETRASLNEETGSAAYGAIRSGNTKVLNKVADISAQTDALAAGAMAAAELEQNAKAAEAAAAAAIKSAAGSGSGGGGGGGGRKSGGGAGATEKPFFGAIEAEIAGLQRQIEMVGKSKAEIAELTARYALLDEAKRRGMTVTDELTAKIDNEAAKVGQLAAEYEAATDKMKAIEDVKSGIDEISDSLANAIVQGESLGDVFGAVVQRMAADLISSGISGLIGSIFGGEGGGGGGGFLGSLFGGARATGGPVSVGKTYLVGERGPELFTPPGAGQIIPNDRLSSRTSAPGDMNLTVNITGASGDPHVIGLVRQGVSEGLSQYNKKLPELVNSISKDPRAR